MLKYLITDSKYYSNFKLTLENSINIHKPSYICFRDKTSSKNAKLAIQIAKYYKIPILINQRTELLELGFDGVHLTSQQIGLIDNFKQCITITSTHTQKEITKAKNSDFVTFSPIFYSKQRKGVGIEELNKMCEIKSEIIALGGIITNKEVKKIENSKALGFGSIRYFVRNENG